MSEENKAIVLRYMQQVWNEQRLDLVEQFLAEDVSVGNAPGLTDRNSVSAFIASTLETFPDLSMVIEDVIAEGNRVALRLTHSGTMRGELLGMPPTGKHATWLGVFIMHLADGKIAEIWGLSDVPSMMQQLGVSPPAG